MWQLARILDDSHAAPAAAGHRLDDHGIADGLRDLEGLLFALDRAVAAGQHGHARLLHGTAGLRLVAEQPNHAGVRSDEADVACLAHLREVGALREKAVAGMQRVGAGDFRGADDRRHVQVAVAAARRANADVFIREADVQGVFVGLGIHGDGLDAQFATRENHAQRDLSTIGDEDFFEHD